jgi:hypothetical protein
MIIPAESMDEAQVKISGEKFPKLVLALCDNCCWCLTCFNKRGIVEDCPVCKYRVSLIPMSIEEISSVEIDEHRGLSIHFARKRPRR